MSKTDLILLDTHVWIWLIGGNQRLAHSKSLAVIEKASKANSLKVAAISVWEVAMLEAKQRLTFPMSCLDWVEQALAAPGISLAPLLPAISVESTRLPGEFHGDPADRILVATARKMGAVLVTDDSRIKAYGEAGFVRILPV